MKTTEDVRKYAAEQRIAEAEVPKRGMEAKSKEFVEKGGGLREGSITTRSRGLSSEIAASHRLALRFNPLRRSRVFDSVHE